MHIRLSESAIKRNEISLHTTANSVSLGNFRWLWKQLGSSEKSRLVTASARNGTPLLPTVVIMPKLTTF